MSRDYRLYLNDILQASAFIMQQMEGVTQAALQADEVRLFALLHNLTIIGEAVKHLPADIRSHYSHIPWREIAGIRDIIVHGYFTLNSAILWQVLTESVPELSGEIQKILADLDS